ncbi:MAG: NAD(P)-dependent oxidoreductase [Chitinophagia bacterium]
MSKKVIVTASVHPFLLATLTQKGFEICYEPTITYDQLRLQISDAVGLIVTTRLKIDANIIEAAKSLQWIGRLGSGMELIDTNLAESKGILCVSSPEGNCTAVGEHCLGLLLNLMHRIHSAYGEIKMGQWIRDGNRGEELTGKKVGIIGFGHTGAAFAKVLTGFDVTLLAHDIYPRALGWQQFPDVKMVDLETIQQEAEVITLHLPLTPLTTHFANAHFFEKLVQKPYFLSTCRGGVTSSQALLEALQNGQIRGAGLDVLENERLDSYSQAEKANLDAIMAMPNFILTPHIAGYSQEAYYKMSKILLEKLGVI